MNKIIKWASNNMTPEEFKREVFELFAATQIMEMEKDNTVKKELVFDKLKITLELTDE